MTIRKRSCLKLDLWPCSNFFPTGLLTHSAVVLATQLDESYFTGVVVATRPGKLLFMVAQVVRGLFQVLEKPDPLGKCCLTRTYVGKLKRQMK